MHGTLNRSVTLISSVHCIPMLSSAFAAFVDRVFWHTKSLGGYGQAKKRCLCFWLGLPAAIVAKDMSRSATSGCWYIALMEAPHPSSSTWYLQRSFSHATGFGPASTSAFQSLQDEGKIIDANLTKGAGVLAEVQLNTCSCDRLTAEQLLDTC